MIYTVKINFSIWEEGFARNCRKMLNLLTNEISFVFFRYIAVCYPLLHRDLVHTYSVMRRVMIYTIPVVIVSLLINIPKFFETKIVRNMTELRDHNNVSESYNFTTYTIDVTDLR